MTLTATAVGQTPAPATLRPPQSAAKGIAWMLAATLGMTIMAVLGREVSVEVTTSTLMFWRSTLAFAFMLGIAPAATGGL